MEEPPSAMSGVQHAVELTLLRTDMGLTKALGPADIGSSPCGRIERRESEPGYTFQWFIRLVQAWMVDSHAFVAKMMLEMLKVHIIFQKMNNSAWRGGWQSSG